MGQKHPFMQLLGLRMARDRRGRAEDMARDLNCAVSTYRLAESGALNLNPSLGLKIVKQFGYEYENLVLLLVAIQETEKVESFTDLRHQLETIASVHTNRNFGHLLSCLYKNGFWTNLETKSQDDFYNYLKERVVDWPFKEYLTSLEFGQDAEQKNQIRDNETDSLVNNLPTLYYDIYYSFLEQLQQLPIRLRFSDLGVWESKNLDRFENLFAVIKDPKAIVSLENLMRYQFNYLWKEQFKKARFIFISSGPGNTADKLKKEFSKNLKTALKVNGGAEKLNQLDKVLEKVEFKTISTTVETIKKILTGANHDTRNGAQMEYEGFWVFERKQFVPVGFLANASPDSLDSSYLIYNEGYSINRTEAVAKISLFNSAWEAYK